MFYFSPPIETLAELCSGSGDQARPTTSVSSDDVRALVEMVFHSSLLAYEGRSSLTTVFFETDPRADEPGITFAYPQPVSAKALRDLSSAATIDNSVVVRRIGTALHVIGLGIPRIAGGVILSAPMPGTVVVQVGAKVGLFSINQCEVFDELSSALSGIVIRDVVGDRHAMKGSDWSTAMNQILRQMRHLGRGGTILIVPEEADLEQRLGFCLPWKLKNPSPRFETAKSGEFFSFLEARWKMRELVSRNRKPLADDEPFTTTSEIMEMGEAHVAKLPDQRDCANALAQLTAVDGAVVIDYSLNLVAFGAKILCHSVPNDILEVDFVSKASTVKRLGDLGGTRHQSAARFVTEVDDSVAFVCSQDGPVSLMTRGLETGSIRVWRRLELALLTSSFRR